MANNLLQKGYQLVVHDVVESAVSVAVSAGAKKASSPAEVTGNVVCHMNRVFVCVGGTCKIAV